MYPWTNQKLPYYFSKKILKDYYNKGQLHPYKWGFFVLEGHKLKSLFIYNEYRGHGLASKIIQTLVERDKDITIAQPLKRITPIKKIIIKLGFKPSGVIVQGRKSKLEIWGLA